MRDLAGCLLEVGALILYLDDSPSGSVLHFGTVEHVTDLEAGIVVIFNGEEESYVTSESKDVLRILRTQIPVSIRDEVIKLSEGLKSH